MDVKMGFILLGQEWDTSKKWRLRELGTNATYNGQWWGISEMIVNIHDNILKFLTIQRTIKLFMLRITVKLMIKRLTQRSLSDVNLYVIPITSINHNLHILLLLLSRFSRVRFNATPETAAHQAPPSLGLSRQEHWSGLPFPSPMHESEKWKWSRSVMSDS